MTINEAQDEVIEQFQDFTDWMDYFIDRIGLKDHLSPTRSNGLLAMVKQIKMYALAYESKH